MHRTNISFEMRLFNSKEYYLQGKHDAMKNCLLRKYLGGWEGFSSLFLAL